MTDSTLYLDHFELEQSPFRQEPDPGIYYQGAGHPAVLRSLLHDIGEEKPLIKLTGGEGVGKTFLNLLLTRSLSPETYDIVTLDHPVGSFEDLLRTVCLALGQGDEDNAATRKFVGEFNELLQRKRNRQEKVLLVIDEAEKIFLATLERLVKMICETGEGVLQVLLIGRLELDHNLEQLKEYCSNVDIQAGYILEPLNFQQTKEYLQYRLHAAGIPGSRHLEVFSDPAAAAIHEIARGNISLTNTLAENGLKKATSLAMNEVGPELLMPYQQNKNKDRAPVVGYFGALIRYKWWAAAAFLLILLVVALLPDEDEREVPQAGEEFTLEDVILEKPEIVMREEDVPALERPPLPDPLSSAQGEKDLVSPEPEKPREMAGTEKVKPGPLPTGEKTLPPGTGRRQETAAPLPPEHTSDDPGLPAAVAETGKTVEPERTPPIIVQAEGRKKRGPVLPEQKTKEDEQATLAAALFRERLRASSNWLAWAYRGGYTIQLMMLTADDAEENLKNILIQEEYSPVLEDIYIVKRNAPPPALFVYYGMYQTLDEARRERDNLPAVLQGHQPYALSIKEALQKIEE